MDTKFKKGFTPWNKGKKLSTKHIKNLSISHIGKGLGNTHGFKKGQPCWLKGKKRTYKSPTEFKKGHGLRENNINWAGGKSFEEYTVNWGRTLKRSIRERDRYTCQICKEPQGEEALCVHHIDYNKKNCSPKNLISLCRNCHLKTNKRREFWIKYFTGVTDTGYITIEGY